MVNTMRESESGDLMFLGDDILNYFRNIEIKHHFTEPATVRAEMDIHTFFKIVELLGYANTELEDSSKIDFKLKFDDLFN